MDLESWRDKILGPDGLMAHPAAEWMIAAAVAAGLWLLLSAVNAFVLARLRKSRRAAEPGRWQATAVELIARIKFFFFLALGLAAAMATAELPDRVETMIGWAVTVAVFLQAALWLDRLVLVIADWRLQRGEATPATTRNARAIITFVGRFATWTLITLLMLDNLGVDITALVAGLGIGGIAVALAAQNILGDLFASLAIVLDRPFEVGDFIIVGDKMGTVEQIGIKTTRLRSLTGEQLICANTDLLTSRIHNYKRMDERRIVFGLGVTYDTPAETMEKLPGVLREIIEAQDKTRFERAHFKGYGDSALSLECVYWVLSPDFAVYMDVQQAINLEVLRRFRDLGADFAFPTRTVHVQAAGAPEDGGEAEGSGEKEGSFAAQASE